MSEERPHVMINQFPCENIVTVKDCLASVARRLKGGTSPDWLPETFNLQTELPQFIKHYQLRQNRLGATFKKKRLRIGYYVIFESVKNDLISNH